MLKSPSSAVQDFSTGERGGSFQNSARLSSPLFLYPSLSYSASSRPSHLSRGTEIQSVLCLHRPYPIVGNDLEVPQEFATHLDFVTGLRDPPRRFPMPAPTHEERWGAYRLDAIYRNPIRSSSDILEPLVNTVSSTDLSLATQTLKINSTVRFSVGRSSTGPRNAAGGGRMLPFYARASRSGR